MINVELFPVDNFLQDQIVKHVERFPVDMFTNRITVNPVYLFLR